jgi:hypothetical protein
MTLRLGPPHSSPSLDTALTASDVLDLDDHQSFGGKV